MSNSGFVSIIIPCRNEEKFIGKCLDSIITQDYPKDKMEVFVVDGMSEDKTRDILKTYSTKYPFITLLDNPKKIIPTAMNIGIKNAKGEIIMKCDAHSESPKDYISKCVKYLEEFGADNVGAMCNYIPRKSTVMGKAIVASLCHSFGVGNSYSRIGVKEPIFSDTAYGGCYKREVFERIGLYDENIARSEDITINSKLRKAGGKILLVPEIKIHYYTRSNFFEFCKHNFDNGLWAIIPFKYTDIIPVSLRHFVPLAFVLSLVGVGILSFFSSIFVWLFLLIVGSYFLANIYFSTKIVLKEKDLKFLVIMSIIFTSLHLSYGLGSVWGLIKVSVSKRFWKNLKHILVDKSNDKASI